ncbi:MAG: hypothetical protein PHW04_07245 [Candidatus Wallbacteria bacterium]|nr:hypothetical protein [Candidatus Wallbacteria bacterium]
MKKLLLTFLCIAGSISAATLYGKIYDEAALTSVANAEITVMARKTTSDLNGNYQFKNVDGIVIISVKAKNYSTFTNTISIDKNKTRYDIPLKSMTSKTPVQDVEKTLQKIEIPQIEPNPAAQVTTKFDIPSEKPLKKNPSPAEGSIQENLKLPEETVAGFAEESTFNEAKKALDDGDFVPAMPKFYQVMVLGRDLTRKMKSCYYIAIIYKAQSQYSVSLDYLYKTLAYATHTREDKTFINQLKSEIAQVYSLLNNYALAKPMVDEVLRDESVNFPLTNFNCYSFYTDFYQKKDNFQQLELYLKKAIQTNVNSQLKSKPYLSVIDLYIQREEYADAEKYLNQLKGFFQSQETEKREVLLLALKEYQTSLQKGDIPTVTKSVIPGLAKALDIDPNYSQALCYLVNIEFLTGKLTNNLQLALSAKDHVQKLISLDPEFKDQTGKKPSDMLKEIETFLKNF